MGKYICIIYDKGLIVQYIKSLHKSIRKLTTGKKEEKKNMNNIETIMEKVLGSL